MKVDLPQPESAATPMTTGVSPSFKAIIKLEDVDGAETRILFPVKNALGVKAATGVTARADTQAKNFILTIWF